MEDTLGDGRLLLMNGNNSALMLLVRVIEMIGKLALNVNTGKSGRKYCRNVTDGTMSFWPVWHLWWWKNRP